VWRRQVGKDAARCFRRIGVAGLTDAVNGSVKFCVDIGDRRLREQGSAVEAQFGGRPGLGSPVAPTMVKVGRLKPPKLLALYQSTDDYWPPQSEGVSSWFASAVKKAGFSGPPIFAR